MTSTKVLVVDDEPTVREVVVGYLRRDGHDVAEAADGNTALELLDADPPDLVVLDMMLPGVNGLDILRRVRSSSESKSSSNLAIRVRITLSMSIGTLSSSP
ncbi:MAG: response regulator, partial [Actinomycetota bacterium]